MRKVLCLISILCSVYAVPVTPPAYSGLDYSGAQALISQQPYSQAQSQPQYITIPAIPQARPPIYQNPQVQRQQYVPGPPTQIVSQLLLPSNADRQVAQAAQQIAGPEYAQQIQILQQQGLANQAVATVQRRAQAQALRQQQQLQDAQEQLFGKYGQARQPQAQAQTPAEYQLQYQPQAQNVRPAVRPAPQVYSAKQNREDPEEYDSNASYQFGFDVTDDLNTNYQNRKEQRDGNKITGSYSVVDSDGFIRTVTYTADPKEGFKAEVVRKPTDIVVKIPTPTPPTKEQYLQAIPSDRGSPGPKGNVIYQY